MNGLGISLVTYSASCFSVSFVFFTSSYSNNTGTREKYRIEIIWNGKNLFQYVNGELDAKGDAVGILNLTKTIPPPERKVLDDTMKSLADYGKPDKEEPLESEDERVERILSSGGNLSIGYERFDKYVRGKFSGTLSRISVAVSEFPPRNIPVDNSISARFDRFLDHVRRELPEELMHTVLSRVARHSKPHKVHSRSILRLVGRIRRRCRPIRRRLQSCAACAS